MTTSPNISPARVEDEARRLNRFFGLSARALDRVLDEIRPWLARYAEVVITESGFELITGGRGPDAQRAMANVGHRRGLPASVTALFRSLADLDNEAMCGLKIPFGSADAAPTLYVRCMLDLDVARATLEDALASAPDLELDLEELASALAGNHVLYGVGLTFSAADGLILKTYTLRNLDDSFHEQTGTGAAPGFLSLRFCRRGLHEEHKRYLPEVGLHELELADPGWARTLDMLRGELGYDVAGHVGRNSVGDTPGPYKIYVERIGAIPTDARRV